MVPVLFAPLAQLRRVDIELWGQAQLPDLNFELCSENRVTGRHVSCPVSIPALSDHGWVRGGWEHGQR